MSLASRTLGWIDMQGYRLTDAEKRRLTIPLKFAPALCALFAAVSLAQQSVAGFAALAVIAFVGGLLPRHLFDYLYAVALEPLLRTGLPPTNPPQRHFACLMGSAMLATAAVGFAVGFDALAWTLGLAFIGAATLVTLTNWCLPSFIYNLTVGRAQSHHSSRAVM